MKNIPSHLLEIHHHESAGYKPMVDYGAWRVAILRYYDDLLPENISTMQRHNETDEVFVLLGGRCILFIGEGGETVTSIGAIDLEPGKLYNVKRGVWHNHTLSDDASVLVVENRDTTVDNSPKIPLNAEQRLRIVDLTRDLWRTHS